MQKKVFFKASWRILCDFLKRGKQPTLNQLSFINKRRMGPSGITLELCCLQKYFISHGNFKKLFVFNIKTLPPRPSQSHFVKNSRQNMFLKNTWWTRQGCKIKRKSRNRELMWLEYKTFRAALCLWTENMLRHLPRKFGSSGPLLLSVDNSTLPISPGTIWDRQRLCEVTYCGRPATGRQGHRSLRVPHHPPALQRHQEKDCSFSVCVRMDSDFTWGRAWGEAASSGSASWGLWGLKEPSTNTYQL